MENLRCIGVFVRVVELRSFAVAAVDPCAAERPRAEHLELRKAGEIRQVTVQGNLCINDGLALVQAGQAAMASSISPTSNVEPLLGIHDLHRRRFAGPVGQQRHHFVSGDARGRGASPKVRAFVEFVTALFGDVRPEDGSPAHGHRARHWPMLRA